MAKGTIEIEIDVPEGTGFTDAIVSAAAAQLIAERMADRFDAMARSAMADAEAQAREVIAAIDAENEPPF